MRRSRVRISVGPFYFLFVISLSSLRKNSKTIFRGVANINWVNGILRNQDERFEFEFKTKKFSKGSSVKIFQRENLHYVIDYTYNRLSFQIIEIDSKNKIFFNKIFVREIIWSIILIMARKSAILRSLKSVVSPVGNQVGKPVLKQKNLSWTKIGSGVILVATTGSAFLYYSKLKLEQEEIKQENYSINYRY